MGMEMVAYAVMVVGAKAVKRRAVAQHRGVRTRPVNPKQCQAVVTKADQRRVGLADIVAVVVKTPALAALIAVCMAMWIQV